MKKALLKFQRLMLGKVKNENECNLAFYQCQAEMTNDFWEKSDLSPRDNFYVLTNCSVKRRALIIKE